METNGKLFDNSPNYEVIKSKKIIKKLMCLIALLIIIFIVVLILIRRKISIIDPNSNNQILMKIFQMNHHLI